MAEARILVVYKLPNGLEPFTQWMDELKDKPTKGRIAMRLRHMKEGNLGDIKSVGDGVWEARFHFGPGWRIYFGQDGQQIVLLLTGGEKASQNQDISMAKIYWRNYKARKAHP